MAEFIQNLVYIALTIGMIMAIAIGVAGIFVAVVWKWALKNGKIVIREKGK